MAERAGVVLADSSAITPDRNAYAARLRAVYDEGAPACGRRGPSKATCVLPPDHGGTLHEGNGFDQWGPKYERWETR